MSSLLKENKFECRVSSVLNKNVKSYGKKHMFDSSNETCWNSDAGSPQWIIINFEEECDLSSFEIEFQGGFAGKDCHLEAGSNEKNMAVVEAFYPEDTNNLQRFNLKLLYIIYRCTHDMQYIKFLMLYCHNQLMDRIRVNKENEGC